MAPLLELKLRPAGSAGLTPKLVTCPVTVGVSGPMASCTVNSGAAGYCRSDGAVVAGGGRAPPPPPQETRSRKSKNGKICQLLCLHMRAEISLSHRRPMVEL